MLALLSLVLATTVWVLGLVDSVSKPSVAPALSLEQQELALLAEPKVPAPLQSLLVGADPGAALLNSLRQTPLDRLDDRQALLFAALESDPESLGTLRQAAPRADAFVELQKALTDLDARDVSADDRARLLTQAPDPLVRRLACEALGGDPTS